MIRRILAVGVVAFATATPALATEAAIQISPRVGYGMLRIDEDKTLSGERETVDALNVGVMIGAVTPFGLMFEGGIHRDYGQSYFGADDRYELSTLSIAVGYQFETDSGARLVPKVGRAQWRLHDEEGRLFGVGSGAERTFEGYDYFWELTVQKRVGRSNAIGVTFKDNPFEFGSARAVNFTMTFDL